MPLDHINSLRNLDLPVIVQSETPNPFERPTMSQWLPGDLMK